MARLIIHIGTKKTGTTTLQGHLKANHAWLADRGIFVSLASGSEEDKRVSRAYMAGNPADAATWFSEARRFVATGGHTAILTAESLADLLPDEIAAIKRDIPAIFGEVRIVLYVRRQDMASVSHYSTSIKGGGVSKSLMSNGMGDRGRRAINYGSIVRDWGRCFGRDAVAVYNYGERHLGSWDIIDHFSSTFDAAISEAPRNAGIRNISLSPVHLAYLRRFNLHLNQNPSIKKGDIRARFLQLLQGVGTGRISLRPSRSAAEAFYGLCCTNRLTAGLPLSPDRPIPRPL